MLKLAVQAGCQLVDCERDLLEGRALKYITENKGKCLVVCSHHEWVPKVVKSHVFAADLSSCAKKGVDVAKVVWAAASPADCIQVREAVASTALQIPSIALLMGEAGKLTRVLNSVLTLATHEEIVKSAGGAAAPGQMSIAEVCQVRRALGMLGDPAYAEKNEAPVEEPVPDAIINATNGTATQQVRQEQFGYYGQFR